MVQRHHVAQSLKCLPLTSPENVVDLWSTLAISNYVLWKPYRYLREKRGVDGGIQAPSTSYQDWSSYWSKLTNCSTKHLRNYASSLQSQRTEAEGRLPNSYYEASVILKPKRGRHYKKATEQCLLWAYTQKASTENSKSNPTIFKQIQPSRIHPRYTKQVHHVKINYCNPSPKLNQKNHTIWLKLLVN